ncbi:MAG: diphthine--ammonia ligase [Oscillospiraceae bacterium]
MNKKFVLSFSCGKDSTLALHRMIKNGYKPVALLIMINLEENKSWFHGVSLEIISLIAKSLDIKLILCKSTPEEYEKNIRQALLKAKNMGADFACFGDIDIYEHFNWCTKQCNDVNINAIFPLWQEDRELLTKEFIDYGYTALIKCIKNDVLPNNILGKPLNYDMIKIFKNYNVDICGENGEYHTLVVDGPLFKNKIDINLGNIIRFEHVTVIDIYL